jgi:hypothetical protein
VEFFVKKTHLSRRETLNCTQEVFPMKKELEKLHSQVFGVANRYSDVKKRRELEQVFEVLKKEFSRQHIQSQRVMALLRSIMSQQPGSAKAVNEFLRSPQVSGLMQSGGSFMG